MSFELDVHDFEYVFPCSLCKKRTGPVETCKVTCGFYRMSAMELSDVKTDMQKLIHDRAILTK